MKITVFQEEQLVPEKEVCLRVIPSGLRGLPTLVVVDPRTGESLPGGFLMTIGQDGIFRLCYAIGRSIGLPVEGTNRTVVVREAR